MAAATANETRQEFAHEPKVTVDSLEDVKHDVEAPQEEIKIEVCRGVELFRTAHNV